jgi:hypothetical protein
MQGLHRILQLPLQFVIACRGAIGLSPHESPLLISQPKFSLMLHHHLRREHDIAQRIHRRMWGLGLLSGLWLLWRIGLLSRRRHCAQKKYGS